MSIIVGGVEAEIAGVKSLKAHGEHWAKLVRYNARSKPVLIGILHKTIADDPEHVVDSMSPSSSSWGGAKDTVLWWQDRKHPKTGEADPVSGTHFVAGFDGSLVQTEDPLQVVGWHAHTVNERSWGAELKEYSGGRVEARTLQTGLALTLHMTKRCRIQRQIPRPYPKVRSTDATPLERAKNGGKDLVGVLGHRDTCWAWDQDNRRYFVDRNRWDPGDSIFDMLEASGFERFDFAQGEDLAVWKARQKILFEHGLYLGVIDGIAAGGTSTALLGAGIPDGVFTQWPLMAERTPLIDKLVAAHA